MQKRSVNDFSFPITDVSLNSPLQLRTISEFPYPQLTLNNVVGKQPTNPVAELLHSERLKDFRCCHFSLSEFSNNSNPPPSGKDDFADVSDHKVEIDYQNIIKKKTFWARDIEVHNVQVHPPLCLCGSDSDLAFQMHIRAFLWSKDLLTVSGNQPSPSTSPHPSIIDTYHARTFNGPPPGSASLSWHHTISSPWNQWVIQELVTEFMAGVASGQYERLSKLPTCDWIHCNITQKLQWQLRSLKTAFRSAVNETEEEHTHQVTQSTNTRLTLACHYQRKKNVCYSHNYWLYILTPPAL